MESASQGIFQGMFGMPRYAPAWFSAFLFALLLLFLNELPVNMKTYTVPSLLVYSLGAAILGTLHRLLGLHYVPQSGGNNEKPIPIEWKIALLVLHVTWFGAFVAYIGDVDFIVKTSSDATAFVVDDGTEDATFGINIGYEIQATDLAAATTIAIGSNVLNLTCDGNETLTTITGAPVGMVLTILHGDTECTINDTDDDTADQIDMLGANNDLVGAADLIVQLVYNGTSWKAISESAN